MTGMSPRWPDAEMQCLEGIVIITISFYYINHYHLLVLLFLFYIVIIPIFLCLSLEPLILPDQVDGEQAAHHEGGRMLALGKRR